MTETILKVENLSKTYKTSRGVVSALDGIGLEIKRGEVLGLVGESGCGKSTLAKALMRLIEVDNGKIELDGVDLLSLQGEALRKQRHRFQMIFQDPFASLNPREKVSSILEAPLVVHGRGSAAERRQRVEWLMQKVGLRPEMADRLPHEFSGGQRQRIGIARAIALNPEFIICDEPVSALDVSVRAQVMNLLADLRKEFSLSYLFISHDLSIVRHIADRVAVMYLGRLVEVGSPRKIFSAPAHPYTRALLDSFPAPDPAAAASKSRQILRGEVPSPINPPTGCRFHPRCPMAKEICSRERPVLRSMTHGDSVACHFPLNGEHLVREPDLLIS